MSDAKETEQSGTAVKALAAAAATGAATYAVRKALATRNGHGEDEVNEEPESSADDEDTDDEDTEDEDDAPEDSADDEDDDSAESNGGGSAKGSLRELVSSPRLASFSQLLVPLAGEAADSAGRYVAEHAPESVRKQVVNRFIDAYNKAS